MKETEEYIKKDPQNAYKYAKYVLEDRWPEAEPEPFILKKSGSDCLYALCVLKDRWPEAESQIKKDKASFQCIMICCAMNLFDLKENLRLIIF